MLDSSAMPAQTFAVPPPQDDEPITPKSVRAALLEPLRRPGPPIRRQFLQHHGGDRRPGLLSAFVAEQRLIALRLYMLLHTLALKEPWDKHLPARTWALALGRTNKGAESTISRNWAWLKDKGLITAERSRGVLGVALRQEDGEADYTRPRGRYFVLPDVYFRLGWDGKLDLPSTAVLLIALSKSTKDPWFTLRAEVETDWWGMSPDTLRRGLDGLQDAGLLHVHLRQVHDVRARTRTTRVNTYCLLGNFMHPEQRVLPRPEDA